MAARLKKGDTVGVISGKYKGQQGRLLELLDNGRVRVEGLAMVKKHLKPNRDPKVAQGGIVVRVGSIHASNVQPLDPRDGKPVKIGFKSLTDGRKVRVARRSGEVLAKE